MSGVFADAQIEKFCNDVAGSFLLPANELPVVGVDLNTDVETAGRQIGEFAEERRLSRSMVAYSLLRAGSLTDDTWSTLTGRFQAQWRQSRDGRRERQKDGAGPNYYIVRRHRLGSALLHFVSRNMSDSILTPTRASQVLGVKPGMPPLLSAVGQSIGLAP